jgi:hypothetical protein
MLRLIERVLAHLILLTQFVKEHFPLSCRWATVQPSDNSIGFLNVKHKYYNLFTPL